MASESTALRCAFCLLPPNCKSNAGKFKNLFGPTNSAGTEQMVLNWLLSSKGIPLNSIFRRDSRLCIFCQRMLKAIDRHQKELHTVIVKAESILQQLCLASCGVNQSQTFYGSTATQQPIHMLDDQQGHGSGVLRPLSSNDEATANEPDSSTDVVTPTLQDSEVTTAGPRLQVGQKRPISRESNDPHARVVVDYPCGSTETYDLTPKRSKPVVSLSRRCYNAAAKGFTKSECLSDRIVHSLTIEVRKEMDHICSDDHKSMLRNGDKDALKEFKWRDVCVELETHVPTLHALLRGILPKSNENFIAFVMSMILKKRCERMSLVQRVVSTLLYGHSAKKQTYACLQPFMVCMSAPSTPRIIDVMVDNYNAEVISWTDDLRKNFELKSNIGSLFTLPWDDMFDEEMYDDSDAESCCSDCCSDASPEWENFDFAEEDEINIQMTTAQSTSDGSEVSACNQFSDASGRVEETTESEANTSTKGFVIVGDNLDKNLRPSHQREDRQTQSLHVFHSCAIKNRVDVSSLSDEPNSAVLTVDKFLLSKDDVAKVLKEFEVLISRMLVQNMEEFQSQSKLVTWHIQSKFHKEMSSKSVVVPLGVQLKNEAYLVEMAQIMDGFNQYIPSEESLQTLNVNGTDHTYDGSKLMQILFFGDQLTVARARGASTLREPQMKCLDRLEGFVPTIADWHARMCLLQTMWKRFFNPKSYDKGTLNQIKHLIHRTAVGKDPKHNMKPTEDFLKVVLCAHVVAAAKQCLKEDDSLGDCVVAASKIVEKFVHISYSTEPIISGSNDRGFEYTRDLFTMSLVWHGFHDAVQEGDGDRILLYWKVLLPIFQQQGHYNYAKEAFILLAQSMFFSERKATELKWNRTVNTTGRAGCNIPCDLHMEHLNRRLKYLIGNLGPNASPKTIGRAAKSLGVVHQVCKQFEEQAGATINKPYASYPSFQKDLSKIVELLEKEQMFRVHDGRSLKTYKKKSSLTSSFNWEKVAKWVKSKLIKVKIN